MTRFDQGGLSPCQRAGASNPVVALLFLIVLVGMCNPAGATAFSFEDSADEGAELQPSGTVIESVTSSQPLHFWFRSETHSVFKLGIQQRDMNLQVTVDRPDGTTLIERTTPISGVTPIVAEANLAGTYSITVIPERIDSRARRFSISLEILGRPNPRRLTEVAASAALQSGDQLVTQWNISSLDEALARYEYAEKEWRVTGDSEGACTALVRQGDVHATRGQLRAALSAYQAALQLVSGGSHVDRKIDILNAMAALALAFTDLEKAKKDADAANNLSLSISYDEGRARALTEMAGVEFYRTNGAEAQSNLDEAMSIWAKTPDRQGEVITLMNMSYVSSSKSEYASAYEYLTRALKMSRSIDDEFAEARADADMGNYYVRVDELAKARDSFNASLNLVAKMGSFNLEAIVLDDLGYYLENLGDPSSYALYKRSVLLAQRADHPLMYAIILSDLSRASIANGRASQALEYSKTEHQLAVDLHDGLMISQSLRDIGETYLATGRVKLALKFFTQGQDPDLLGPNSVELANTKIEIARALERLGRAPDALDAYREAAALSHSIASIRAEADARYHIAHIESAEGRLDLALPEIEKSVALVESMRTKVSADDTRILWFSPFHAIYALYIDVLMQLSLQSTDTSMARRGFQIAEQSIARSFVELLHQAQVESGNSHDLVREYASIRRLLVEKQADESRLLSASLEEENMHKVALEISSLHGRQVQIESLLNARDWEDFQVQVDPLGIDEVQTLIGDEDIVIEYSLGSRHSYLWAISKAGFSSYVLPSESEIELLVRQFRQALVSPGIHAMPEVANFAGKPGSEEVLAAELGRVLLEPVTDLSRFRRIVLVADGALQYLPFGALITKQGGQGSSPEIKRVAQEHEVTNLPSMTTLSVLRSRQNSSGLPRRGLLMFADPVFESDDPRIEPVGYRRSQGRALTKPVGTIPDAGDLSTTTRHFPRLPGTRQEADVIGEVVPKQSAEILLGFEANLRRAESEELQNYRFIHFATHSVLDNEHPELSGVILSMFNHDGNHEDGYLRLKDIYRLKLSAEFVVLSACETALGKNIKGEGIVGLTRGFMYAGAPSVVATLWRVDDDATSEFMKWFYKGIFEHHETPAAALREAQIEMCKQARWRSPYYWGAFIIEGDWLSTDGRVTNIPK